MNSHNPASKIAELEVDEHHQVISHHAKSFYWASCFFPKNTFQDVCLLYSFCRWIDDLADESHPSEATDNLQQAIDQLEGRAAASPLVIEFHRLCERTGLRVEYAKELIKGAVSDLNEVQIKDDKELAVYCYRVAGAVGLMMCPVIGVQSENAKTFAVDLGVAMQLTNICRDVAEDARMGRVYLPATRLQSLGLKPSDLIEGRAPAEKVAIVVRDLLKEADQYYFSAFKGMRYIPWQTRLPIILAARIYRAIGLKLRFWNYNALRGRAYVTMAGKVLWTLRGFVDFLNPRLWGLGRPPIHNPLLHQNLKGLPGIRA